MNFPLFMETKTTQYGSHQVMTGASKPIKTMYLNIDTRFRDDTNTSTLANYTFTLPQKINSIRSMTVVSAEIPITVYNFSTAIGNTHFYLSDSAATSTTTATQITIPDAYYSTAVELVAAVNSALTTAGEDLQLTYYTGAGGVGYSCSLDNTASAAATYVNMGNIERAAHEKSTLRNRLGFRLGFRDTQYLCAAGSGVSGESLIDVAPPKYLFLVVDDFTRSANTFVSPFYLSVLNKNIIAKIPVDATKYSFGDVIQAAVINGTLISDTRTYTGTGADIQRLVISLVDEYGSLVDLNQQDFSFVLKLEVEV